MKKKILIITRSFYPDNWPRAFRATELSKEFSRQGHFVKVITPKRQIHEDFERENNIIISDLGTIKFKTLNESGFILISLTKKIINRLGGWLFEYPNIEFVRLVSRALKKESGYDILISVAHPHTIHWGVAKTWTMRKAAKIWIADCGDPYMGQENNSYKPPFYFGWVEKWFMRRADFVTVPTLDSVSAYYPEFKPKIRIIPQGFRFEDIKVYDGAVSNEIIHFGYAGMFIPGRRDPSEFLHFLNSLDKSFKFEFHIYTHNATLIDPFINDSNGRIKLHPVMPREEVLFELSRMNFVVNFENTGKKQTPSKLIDYGIINKPVLSIKYGDLHTNVILEFLKSDFTHKMELPDISQYRIERVCNEFLKLCDE